MGRCMYHDGAVYLGTHWWWDDEENEYTCCARWKFEKNYPEMPDFWYLEEVEIDKYNGRPDVMCTRVEEGSPLWNSIQKDGPPMNMTMENE